jgi:hypothetical protein
LGGTYGYFQLRHWLVSEGGEFTVNGYGSVATGTIIRLFDVFIRWNSMERAD